MVGHHLRFGSDALWEALLEDPDDPLVMLLTVVVMMSRSVVLLMVVVMMRGSMVLIALVTLRAHITSITGVVLP